MTTLNQIPLSVPLPPVLPLRLPLPDGALLTISGRVPAETADRRAAVLAAQLYAFCGRLDHPDGYLTAYVGQSGALQDARAATSFTRWVVTQRRINPPTAMALLHRDTPWRPEFRLHLEARVIQRLSTTAGMIATLNRHTNAQTASARLTGTEVTAAEKLADTIAHNIWQHVFAGRSNEVAWPVPASNTREQAVRVLHRAARLEHRALDVDEICARLLAIGHPTVGQTFAYSVRRDLEQREPAPGYQRIHSAWHRGRRVFYAATLTRTVALDGYDAAHPRTPKPAASSARRVAAPTRPPRQRRCHATAPTPSRPAPKAPGR